MNIFILSYDPEKAARMQCDKHAVKMPLENTQMLCSNAHYFTGLDMPYKPVHMNHPCTVWLRASRKNYEWFSAYAESLFAEYTKRYGKIHKCAQEAYPAACEVIEDNFDQFPDIDIMTPFALCLGPDKAKYVHPDSPVQSYRSFYKADKADFAEWNKGTSAPDWWTL